MKPTFTRRAFGMMSAGSLSFAGSNLPARAQTPESTPALDRYSTLLERLDAFDPQATLDLLMASPFEITTIVPLAEFADVGPLALEFGEDDPFAEDAIGAVQLADPDATSGIGAFFVYPDEASATSAIKRAISEETSDDISFEPIDRLAGLESTMMVIGDQRANVLTLARYVVILATDDFLADGAYSNSFNAQLRALHHAIGMISHLNAVLRPSNLP